MVGYKRDRSPFFYPLLSSSLRGPFVLSSLAKPKVDWKGTVRSLSNFRYLTSCSGVLEICWEIKLWPNSEVPSSILQAQQRRIVVAKFCDSLCNSRCLTGSHLKSSVEVQVDRRTPYITEGNYTTKRFNPVYMGANSFYTRVSVLAL